MKRISDFEGKTSDPVSVEYISTPSGIIPVYFIRSFHSLTQFIGYGKYINREWGNVYLRGQTSLYDGYLSPSVLRREKISGDNHPATNKADAGKDNTVKFLPIRYDQRISKYKYYIKESTKGTKHFDNWNRDIIEPLLQHYGIKTHWLDIVDKMGYPNVHTIIG